MSILIGQRVTRFWKGERFIFERVGKGEWKCVYKDCSIIPEQIIEGLGE